MLPCLRFLLRNKLGVFTNAKSHVSLNSKRIEGCRQTRNVGVDRSFRRTVSLFLCLHALNFVVKIIAQRIILRKIILKIFITLVMLLLKWWNISFLLKSLFPFSWCLRIQYGLLKNYLLGNNFYHTTSLSAWYLHRWDLALNISASVPKNTRVPIYSLAFIRAPSTRIRFCLKTQIVCTDFLPVHTYPVNTEIENETFQKRIPEWKYLKMSFPVLAWADENGTF